MSDLSPLSGSFYAREFQTLNLSPKVAGECQQLLDEMSQETAARARELIDDLIDQLKTAAASPRALQTQIESMQRQIGELFNGMRSEMMSALKEKFGNQLTQGQYSKLVNDVVNEMQNSINVKAEIEQETELKNRLKGKTIYDVAGTTGTPTTAATTGPDVTPQWEKDLLANISQWYSHNGVGSPGYSFVGEMRALIMTGNFTTENDALAAIQSKLINPSSTNTIDIYMKHPDIFPNFPGKDANNIFNSINSEIFGGQLKLPNPTTMDTWYLRTYNYMLTLDPNKQPNDVNLLNGLLKHIHDTSGSIDPADLTSLRTWIKSNLMTFYASSSAITKSTFTDITGVGPVIPSDKTLGDAIMYLNEWIKNNPNNAAGIRLVQALLNDFKKFQPPDAHTYQEGVQDFIKTYLSGKDDLYMQFYPGLTQATISDISNSVLYNLLPSPPPTAIDQIFMDALAKKDGASPKLLALINKLISEIQNVGSYGSITDIRNWALTNVYTDSNWNTMDQTDRVTFATLAKLEPLDYFISQIKKWASSYGADSPQAKLANYLIAQLQKNEGKTPPTFLSNITSQLHDLLFANSTKKFDIYLTIPGITEDDLKNMCNLLTDGNQGQVAFSPMTDMDKLYNNFIKQENAASDPKDKELFKQAADAILNTYGSFNSQGLTDWAQSMIDKDQPPFIDATFDMQSIFAESTKTDILKHYTQNLSKYLAGLSGPLGSGASAFIKDLLAQISKLEGQHPPKNLHDLLQTVSQTLLALKDGKDVHMNYPGLSDDQIQQLQNILGLPREKLTIPSRTAMDKIFYGSYVFLNTATGNDQELAKALWSQLANVKSGDDVSSIRAWGRNFETNTTYKQASPAAQQEFQKILNIGTPSGSFDAIRAEIMAYLVPIDAQYNKDLGLLKDYFARFHYPPTGPTTPQGWTVFLKLLDDVGIQQNNPEIRNLAKSVKVDVERYNLFHTVLNEINDLQKNGKTIQDLVNWAKQMQPTLATTYPDITSADKQEFNLLLNL